jgi:hypothetical protein
MCQVQTAHGATRPLNRSATEYPTCVTISDSLHRSSTPAMVLVAARHAAPATCTPRDKQTRFSNETKIKEKQNKTIPDSNSNLAKSMTHHNQTKELTTWFLNLPLDESIDNKSTKFEVRIQYPMKHS